MARLLVIDDEEAICWGLKRLGESMGHQVVTGSSAEQALELVQREEFEAIILDVRLPGMDGLTAIGRMRAYVGRTPIIVITAFGDLQTAVEAVRAGAFEYIIKPFNTEKIRRVLTRALEVADQLQPETESVAAVEGFVGSTPAIQKVFNRIALAAASDAAVLLQGESGTGKELAARAIHRNSGRADGPFVAVNVASLNPTLAESELFGHVRGAFTGAEHSRTGLLVKADSGTLFLDEVADIPLPTQVKLLRAVEDGEVLPVGADEPVSTEFRIISATHQDLLQQVRANRFRHDLYFRLATFQIELPPLRERKGDIADLAEFFVGRFSEDEASNRNCLSPAAIEELESRSWHGNIRELRNAIEHAVIVSRGGNLMPEHFPPPMPATAGGSLEADVETELRRLLTRWAESKLHDPDSTGRIYDQLLTLVEPPVLQAVIRNQGGQFASSARVLGLHRTTLRKKFDELGLDGPSES